MKTKNLNKAVSRNQERFPQDFAFQLTKDESDSLRFQIGTSNVGRGGRRYLPYVFTEHGVVMAASLLKSNRAIKVSVEIVRAFVRLLHTFTSLKDVSKELTDLKSFLLKHSHTSDREFRRVWQTIEKLSEKRNDKEQRKIGFDLK